MLRIGLDIDDVLYKTSQMIKIEGTIIAQNLWGIKIHPDVSQYSLSDILGVGEYRCRAIAKRLSCTSVNYFNLDAINALKSYRATHRDVQYYIISRRSKSSIKNVISILHNEFDLDITSGWACEGITLKSTLCNRHRIDIMLDDEQDNILDITEHCAKCTPICCSDETVLHNKAFLVSYSGYYITDWSQLERLFTHLRG